MPINPKEWFSDAKGYEEGARPPRLSGEHYYIIRIWSYNMFGTTCQCQLDYFDPFVADCMRETMGYTARRVEDCRLAYHQGNEITFVCGGKTNFLKRPDALLSEVATIASFGLNRAFRERAIEQNKPKVPYHVKAESGFYFRGCCYECNEITDVTSNLVWRQHDCIRRSVFAVARRFYKNEHIGADTPTEELINRFIEDDVQDWSQLEHSFKYGTCYLRTTDVTEDGKTVWVWNSCLPKFLLDPSFIYNNIDIEPTWTNTKNLISPTPSTNQQSETWTPQASQNDSENSPKTTNSSGSLIGRMIAIVRR